MSDQDPRDSYYAGWNQWEHLEEQIDSNQLLQSINNAARNYERLQRRPSSKQSNRGVQVDEIVPKKYA